MRTTLIAVLLCIASLLLPGAHAEQGEALRKQFLDDKAKAEKGDAVSQYNLGIRYNNGLGGCRRRWPGGR